MCFASEAGHRTIEHMVSFILSLVLAFGAMLLWSIERSYRELPLKELKRRARHGDQLAELLYKPAAYGAHLRLVLGTIALFLLALALLTLVNITGMWLGLIVLGLFVGGLATLASRQMSGLSLWLARQLAGPLAWLLERIHPVTDFVVRFVRRHRHISVHTGLYEKTDLVELLERQKGQPDSRISANEIDLLIHSLTFGDKLVGDVLVPKRVVKLVSASEPVGPVLMDELSKSGHSRFPVYETKRDNIVGILYLHDLVGIRQTGTVDRLMSRKLTYVHEDFTLHQTLQAFLKTKQHLFLVVNSFEELVGIITIEDILEQMIGRPIVDEFDHYDDLRAVAAAAAHHDHHDHEEPVGEAKATTDTPEVVK